MPQYLFTYHGSQTPETKAESKKVMAQWTAWFGAMDDTVGGAVGGAVVQPGAPLGVPKTVSGSGVADNGGANPVSGYTVVSADTIDAATEMAKGCPMVVAGNGSVEVAEVLEM